jgi:sialic acid synthase SpsE
MIFSFSAKKILLSVGMSKNEQQKQAADFLRSSPEPLFLRKTPANFSVFYTVVKLHHFSARGKPIPAQVMVV